MLKIIQIRVCVFVLSVVLLMLACNTPPPTLPDTPPDTLITQSATAMQTLDGFRFLIERNGAPAFLDPNETLSFRRAEGDYVAPDQTQATVRVIGPGIVTNVDIISLGETQWETNVMTGVWQELPPNWGFNPAVLFDPDIGLQAVLLADLTQLARLPDEPLEGITEDPVYVLSGTLAGERTHQMSYGLMGPESMSVQLWIDPQTFYLHRAMVTEQPTPESEATVWQIDFQHFDRVVEILPPPE